MRNLFRKIGALMTVGTILGLTAGCGTTPESPSQGGAPPSPVSSPVATSHRTTSSSVAASKKVAGSASSAQVPPPKKSKTPTAPKTVAPTPPPAPVAAAFPEPTPARPLKILVIGDSLGEDLQDGLIDIAGSSSSVQVIPAAVGSTGLVNVAYYNWPNVLKADLSRYHPQVVMVLIGGNDALSFVQNGQFVGFGTALWRHDYGARVNALINEVESYGARVVWVGLPMMSPTSVLSNTSIEELNAVYAQEVKAHAAMATFIPTWSLFQNAQGQFAEYLTDSAGTQVMVRDPDGVHIALPAGAELIGSYVMWHLEQTEGISVCLNGSDLWNQYHFNSCSASVGNPAG